MATTRPSPRLERRALPNPPQELYDRQARTAILIHRTEGERRNGYEVRPLAVVRWSVWRYLTTGGGRGGSALLLLLSSGSAGAGGRPLRAFHCEQDRAVAQAG